MKKILVNLILVLGLAVPMLTMPTAAFADCPAGNTPTGETLQGIGESGKGSCNDSGVGNTINVAVNILSLVVGAVAIIMIMVAGFKYITSGGESQAVANAKSTLIYALVGLAIAVLAQLLVHYVLFQANKAGT